MIRLAKYLLGVSLAANQLVNAATGGRPDETVSFRAARARAQGSKMGAGMCLALNAVDFHHERRDEDHCEKAARHHAEHVQGAR